MMLYPSEIFYSQDSISCDFDARRGCGRKKIGETLDDICEGRCSMYDIPIIQVFMLDDRWVTADNRRLWVFRQLERLGECGRIEVDVIEAIPFWKMNSSSNGETVKIRGGNPGGYWHTKPSSRVEGRMSSRSPSGKNDDGPSFFKTGLLLGGVALACNYLFNK